MIDGIPILDISQSALIAFIVLMILTGRLVPLRQLRDTQKERDDWKATAEKALLANQDERSQKRELLDAMRTSIHFIEATTKAAGVHPEAKP